MSWASPWLLAGLAALAVPVLVHLIRRRDPNRRAFPSLMFLDGTPHETRGQRALRDPLLLLLRLLALAIAVLAFAGPTLTQPDSGANEAAGGDVVLAIDRSLSMQYEGRFEEAVARAKQEIDSLAPGARVALVLFDSTAERARPLTVDRDSVKAALDRAAVRPFGTDIRSGVAAAGALLAESPARRRTLVLVSDFQRGAYSHGGTSLLPPGTDVHVVGVGRDSASNAAVTGVALDSTVGDDPAGVVRITVSARVTQFGGAAPAFAALWIDGREVERLPLAADRATQALRFAPVANPRQPVPASVRIHSDGLAGDDARHFVLAPERALDVLLVSGPAGERADLYLRRALALARRPRAALRMTSAAQLTAEVLDGADVVIVNDAALGPEAHEALSEHVGDGGGAFIVAGGATGGTWPSGPDGYLPGRLGGRMEAKTLEGLSVAEAESITGSGVLVDKARLQGASLGRVFRYRRLSALEGEQVLLRYADGGAALAARRVGAGRVVVLTSTLDNRWNSIPLSAAFVPFVHHIVVALSGKQHALEHFDTGAVLDVARWLDAQAQGAPLAAALLGREPLVVRAPSGERQQIDPGVPFLKLDEPGVYSIDRPDGTGPRLLLAVNVPPPESDVAIVDPGAIGSQLVRMAALPAPAGSAEATEDERAASRWLWRILMVTALALLLVESLVCGRASNVNSSARSTGEAAA